MIGMAAHQGKPVVLWKLSSKLIALPIGPVSSTLAEARSAPESDRPRSEVSGLDTAPASSSAGGPVRSGSAASAVLELIQADGTNAGSG